MKPASRLSLGLIWMVLAFGVVPASAASNVPVPPKSKGLVQQVVLKGEVASSGDPLLASTVGLAQFEFNAETGQNEFRLECTASVISSKLILTAGHCLDQENLDPSKWFVTFSNGVDAIHERRPLKRVVLHPSYYKAQPGQTYKTHPEKTRFDLAIAEFEGGLPEGYRSANLLTDFKSLKEGASYVIAGMGYAKAFSQDQDFHLRKARFEMGFDMDGGPINANSRVIFSYLNASSASVCPGDSGSPAYLIVGGQPMLWGITISGVGTEPGGGCGTFFGHYNLSLAHHMDWIQSVISRGN